MQNTTFKTRFENFTHRAQLLLFATLCCLLLSANAQAQIINTIAGSVPGFSGDGGPATCAGINNCRGAKTDAAGNLYIADNGNHIVRKVDATTGIITTVAGTPLSSGYSGDGGLATAAQLNGPQDVAIDQSTGDLYIVDGGNNVIRVVYAVGGTITPTSTIQTFAGTFPGTAGYSGDGLPANAPGVQLNFPRGIDMDASGTIYIAEWGNNIIRVVQGGIINTFAGNGTYGYGGDGGPATAAQMRAPVGVKYDASSGKVFIADYVNNVIRVVNGGIINTYAGVAASPWGYTGDGGLATAATFNGIWDLAVSPAGDVIICDAFNNVVRSVDPSTNIVTTIVGAYPGPMGFAGDGGPANSAACKLSTPDGAAFDNLGNLIICDHLDKVRIISGGSTTYPTYYNTCVGGTVTLNVNVPGGTWSTTSPDINITPSGTSCTVTGISVGFATVDYTIPCGITITDTVNVASTCGGTSCSDTCYWKVTGNNIIGGNNTFGTLTKDDIQFVTNGTFRAVLEGSGNGNLGINTASPTTFLDVDCTPPTAVPAPSGLRLENLPTGKGNILVVDAKGYVYAATSVASRPGRTADDEYQNQIDQLQQQINDLKTLLAAAGISMPAGNGNTLSVSPNPTSGAVTATYSIAAKFVSALIRVTDNSGKVIMEKPVSGNNGSVDMTIPASVASGQLYCALLVDGKILTTQKLVLLNK